MKFVLSTQELNYLIAKLQNIVSVKPPMPILSNFLIEAYNDELILSATDLTVGIRCHTDAQILEEGSTTLPAKKFSQLIRELTVANVEIATNSDEISMIKAGTSRFKLNGMAKNGFPAIPDLDEAQTISLPQNVLKDLLHRTSFAVSKDDNRYVLTGLQMQIANGVLVFTGTDGKRLARAFNKIEIDPGFSYQGVIPLKAVEEIIKNLTDEGEAKIALMADKIAVEANQTCLMTKLLTGEYPDVARVIPEKADKVVVLHRDELIALLRQVSLFTKDQHQPIRLTLDSGELTLSAHAMDIGEGNVSMPVNYSGPKLEIAFNPGFFLDILRHCKQEAVALGLTDTFNPGVLTDGEAITNSLEMNPLFILMPMRFSED